ncbi:hypothetical protein [Clostridium disporicum]|uniref:hypothetical protein n=1 Tax=Clostridium disporicum TaxID=84024 RepID=UPI0034A0EB6B
MKSLLDLFEEISCKKKRRWINSSYEKLPSSIKNLMNSYKLEIYLITNKEMDALTNDKGVLGLYLNKEKQQIYLNAHQSKSDLTNSFYHELGHFIDKCIGDKLNKNDINSKTDEILLSCFNLEKANFEYLYYSKDISEFFAQSMAELLKGNNPFLFLIPNTSNYTLELLKKVIS